MSLGVKRQSNWSAEVLHEQLETCLLGEAKRGVQLKHTRVNKPHIQEHKTSDSESGSKEAQEHQQLAQKLKRVQLEHSLRLPNVHAALEILALAHVDAFEAHAHVAYTVRNAIASRIEKMNRRQMLECLRLLFPHSQLPLASDLVCMLMERLTPHIPTEYLASIAQSANPRLFMAKLQPSIGLKQTMFASSAACWVAHVDSALGVFAKLVWQRNSLYTHAHALWAPRAPTSLASIALYQYAASSQAHYRTAVAALATAALLYPELTDVAGELRSEMLLSMHDMGFSFPRVTDPLYELLLQLSNITLATAKVPVRPKAGHKDKSPSPYLNELQRTKLQTALERITHSNNCIFERAQQMLVGESGKSAQPKKGRQVKGTKGGSASKAVSALEQFNPALAAPHLDGGLDLITNADLALALSHRSLRSPLLDTILHDLEVGITNSQVPADIPSLVMPTRLALLSICAPFIISASTLVGGRHVVQASPDGSGPKSTIIPTTAKLSRIVTQPIGAALPAALVTGSLMSNTDVNVVSQIASNNLKSAEAAILKVLEGESTGASADTSSVISGWRMDIALPSPQLLVEAATQLSRQECTPLHPDSSLEMDPAVQDHIMRSIYPLVCDLMMSSMLEDPSPASDLVTSALILTEADVSAAGDDSTTVTPKFPLIALQVFGREVISHYISFRLRAHGDSFVLQQLTPSLAQAVDAGGSLYEEMLFAHIIPANLLGSNDEQNQFRLIPCSLLPSLFSALYDLIATPKGAMLPFIQPSALVEITSALGNRTSLSPTELQSGSRFAKSRLAASTTSSSQLSKTSQVCSFSPAAASSFCSNSIEATIANGSPSQYCITESTGLLSVVGGATSADTPVRPSALRVSEKFVVSATSPYSVQAAQYVTAASTPSSLLEEATDGRHEARSHNLHVILSGRITELSESSAILASQLIKQSLGHTVAPRLELLLLPAEDASPLLTAAAISQGTSITSGLHCKLGEVAEPHGPLPNVADEWFGIKSSGWAEQNVAALTTLIKFFLVPAALGERPAARHSTDEAYSAKAAMKLREDLAKQVVQRCSQFPCFANLGSALSESLFSRTQAGHPRTMNHKIHLLILRLLFSTAEVFAGRDDVGATTDDPATALLDTQEGDQSESESETEDKTNPTPHELAQARANDPKHVLGHLLVYALHKLEQDSRVRSLQWHITNPQYREQFGLTRPESDEMSTCVPLPNHSGMLASALVALRRTQIGVAVLMLSPTSIAMLSSAQAGIMCAQFYTGLRWTLLAMKHAGISHPSNLLQADRDDPNQLWIRNLVEENACLVPETGGQLFAEGTWPWYTFLPC